MESSYNIISNDGGSATRLEGRVEDTSAIGSNLFGKLKDGASMFGGGHNDIELRPAEICLREKDNVRVDRLHVVEK